jgi:aspartyl-tRNA(Asn)/glutamyl-tRNA(Gln) amidotransferase subunit B
MNWEVVIGIETHTQLSTASKIFSGASTAFGAAPNSQASAVDIALPGVLPVLNKGAVERAIRFGLAVDGTINKRSVFARKNYFYPDLPKGYQISQYEIPVVQGGSIAIVSPTRGAIKVALTRAHLEEDAGKSLHEGLDSHGALGRGMTGIDLNRAGTPLLEIVSEPDLRSSEEAVVYAKTLHSLVRWIGICDGNMQEGSFRCDANVSVRRAGEAKLGTRCEIKNLNSFRFMHQAIEFEVRRQIELIEDGGNVVQETRLYDPDRNETRPMRSKEDAQDYRYFPDPDLPPLVIDDAWIEQVRSAMPTLPLERQYQLMATDVKNFVALVQRQNEIDEEGDIEVWVEREYRGIKLRDLVLYGLPEADARELTADIDHVAYFESAVDALGGPSDGRAKLVSNWMLGELAAALKESGRRIAQSRVSPNQLAEILMRLRDATIHGRQAKELFDEMWRRDARNEMSRDVTVAISGVSAKGSVGIVDAIIEEKGLKQISDTGAIEKTVDEVLAANAAIVAEYKAGKEKAFNSLVGKAMAATKGKANPAQVNAILKRKLAV